MSGGLPEISELLPQAGGMRLLARVLAHEPSRTVCEARVDASGLFAEPDGGVPAFVALEYMAQCAAAHGGLVARTRGDGSPPAPGLFLGARRVRLAADAFRPGQVLHVEARHCAGEAGLVAFDCAVRDAAGGEPLVEGRLNVYTLETGAGGAGRVGA
jgi:predicted hotdog family 3-hydroxylacyl-ACP dehydratase